ncbi:uncharacterized protein LOC123015953 [Tribolium madens]|uniref:uncharacterized protein LOC123015953 n=1 Tax=Tribolium madens TaxID=41895 RepID=UPI001CF76551|nr:uncharacterized protein LOC123015953 [Tribolium madens]XP_044272015.1 uncharacterized protein LOC123015953 [Tribolium madens]XP_044272022.1 uncharacterized protein LOC123015953 [Tribolium madens]XP_044272030.1 uncharacterized protein LOC123015953 [Tribolium madens]
MLFIKGQFFKTRLFSKTARFFSSDLMPNLSQFSIEPKFNNAEQEKILNILNESNKDQLQCFNVAQTNIKKIENYKKRNGPFKSLNELLEVDGLSVKMLEKMCKQLILDSTNPNVKTTTNENKKTRQILTPQLPTSTDLSTAVGIHLAPMGVSWAKISVSGNQLESWGYEDFTNLPKKMFSTDTFKLALDILNQLPTGDAYIFEGNSSMGQKQSSAVPPYTQQLELCSMLLALINTSSNHNKISQNSVYFLRSKLPARMFKTLVGNECVSCTSVILQLLGDSPDDFTLPCSSITFEEKLKSDYLVQSPAHKELLGQALMLVIAFMDLCIRKNPISIKAIAPNRK